jgi:cell division protein FtsA
VTKDIGIGLRTPLEKAEEIKKKHGCAFQKLLRGEETFTVPGVGGHDDRVVSREGLVSIIEPRMEEILSLVLREIKRTGYGDMLGAGVVLTGGGSLMEGVREKAEDVFQMPVKLGTPTRFTGLTEAARSPIHSTGIGLCMYAAQSEARLTKDNAEGGGGLSHALRKMFSWAKELF